METHCATCSLPFLMNLASFHPAPNPPLPARSPPQTGSGKTAAFCFPIIASMLMANYEPTGRGTRKATPYALILAPTRELTSQIYDEARKFTFNTGIRPVVVYGGAPVVNQVGRRATSGL